MLDTGELRCDVCGVTFPQWSTAWHCACGGTLSWYPGTDALRSIEGSGIWRHARLLPPVSPENRSSLGEVVTPVLESDGVGYKLEYLSPSGSFKDRGAACVVSCLKQMAVESAVIDSSGNAGSAMAAYLADAKISATVFVPEHASGGKRRQIAAYGAEMIMVAGDRSAVTAAAQDHAERTGAVYASHLWSPYFIAGMRTLGAELADLGPLDAVIFPVGSGSLVLGAFQGLAAVAGRAAGEGYEGPRLYGIQVDACRPLVDAFDSGDDDVNVAPAVNGGSIAEGILVARPPRARAVLRAVRTSGGALLSVSDTDVERAMSSLWLRGIYAEPTSAAAEAGRSELIRRGLLAESDRVIVALTGTGLKASS
jgi:threonine synthase